MPDELPDGWDDRSDGGDRSKTTVSKVYDVDGLPDGWDDRGSSDDEEMTELVAEFRQGRQQHNVTKDRDNAPRQVSGEVALSPSRGRRARPGGSVGSALRRHGQGAPERDLAARSQS